MSERADVARGARDGEAEHEGAPKLGERCARELGRAPRRRPLVGRGGRAEETAPHAPPTAGPQIVMAKSCVRPRTTASSATAGLKQPPETGPTAMAPESMVPPIARPKKWLFALRALVAQCFQSLPRVVESSSVSTVSRSDDTHQDAS